MTAYYPRREDNYVRLKDNRTVRFISCDGEYLKGVMLAKEIEVSLDEVVMADLREIYTGDPSERQS